MARTVLSVEEFLAEFPAPIQELSLVLSSLIKEAVSDLMERVYPGWRLIGYRQGNEKKSRYFCFVAPYLDHVRLGFEYGAFLADPLGLLEGTGSQVRHVPITSLAQLQKSQLIPLIQEAVHLASLPKHELFLQQSQNRI